jgi:hypothetical protein
LPSEAENESLLDRERDGDLALRRVAGVDHRVKLHRAEPIGQVQRGLPARLDRADRDHDERRIHRRGARVDLASARQTAGLEQSVEAQRHLDPDPTAQPVRQFAAEGLVAIKFDTRFLTFTLTHRDSPVRG